MNERDLCKMCTEYSEDVRCENKDTCKLMNIIRENQALKKENAELRLHMSYMANPNAIGNRNDMGW